MVLQSGVCCAKADAVVIATVWILFLLQMGKKGVVGQQVLLQCCAGSQSVPLRLSVACVAFLLLQGNCKMRLLGSTAAAAGWGLVVWVSTSQPAWQKEPGRAACLQPGMQALVRWQSSILYRFPGLGAFTNVFCPLTGASSVWMCSATSFLWPFICRVEPCPAHSGPLVLLTFKCVSNKASEPLHQGGLWLNCGSAGLTRKCREASPYHLELFPAWWAFWLGSLVEE